MTALPPVDVLGIGNSCCDRVLPLMHPPRRGETARVRPPLRLTGGQIASAIVGCARLGLGTRMLLRTGADAAGEMQRAALLQAGVDLGACRTVAAAPSAEALILLAPGGERTVIWNTDERLAVDAADITPDLVAASRLLLIDGKDGPACLRAAGLARDLHIPVLADFDCLYPHTASLLPLVTHLVAPEEFIRLFAETVDAGLTRLAATGPACVVATLGAAGSRGCEGGESISSPAFPITAVDTTGAGDAFHAGYAFGCLRGFSLARRLTFANATAALSCAAIGAQTALPSLEQVEALLHAAA